MFDDLVDGVAVGELLPDLTWTHQWLVPADDDLKSIDVSSSAPVNWGTGLGVVRLTGDEPGS